MNTHAPDDEVHIASFVVQHRDGASMALSTMVAGHPDLELAIPGPTRSVVLCESADRHAVMDRIDQIKEVAGVLNVLLVHHHAESRQALDEPLPTATASGAHP